MSILSSSENVINKVLRLGHAFGRPSNLPKPQTVLLDYSSVNIGKPAHAGHLRATLTGHFVRRINEFMGHKVIGINYLGDWGIQFGVLLHGFKTYGNMKELKKDRTKHLFEVYVKACAEYKTDFKNSPIKGKLSHYISAMDKGDRHLLELWNTFRTISIEDLEKTYKRMNIDFTEYQFESQFVGAARSLVSRMLADGLAWRKDGAVICQSFGSDVVLLTNAGSTLYLTRDLAAAIQREEKFQFDRMHYIVNETQTLHFRRLESILRELGHNWMDRCQPWGIHVSFGSVENISTRKGNVVFLRDILDSSRDRMIERLRGNTRLTSEREIEGIADKLGWSFLVETLSRSPRMKPIQGDFYDLGIGVRLQYAHARLCSLESAALEKGLQPQWDESLTSTIMTDSIDRLMMLLLEMEDVVEKAYLTLEPCVIYNYLQRISATSNSLMKTHRVISCENVKSAEGHFATFMACRQVMRTCFHLLGIQPIDKM